MVLQLSPEIASEWLVTSVGSLDELPYELVIPNSTLLFAGTSVFHVIVAAVLDGVDASVVITGPAAAAPVPLEVSMCGLPGALSVIVTVPVRVPVAVGVKVTLIVQLALAAKEVPQVLLCA